VSQDFHFGEFKDNLLRSQSQIQDLLKVLLQRFRIADDGIGQDVDKKRLLSFKRRNRFQTGGASQFVLPRKLVGWKWRHQLSVCRSDIFPARWWREPDIHGRLPGQMLGEKSAGI
jgi:hypothetical protein